MLTRCSMYYSRPSSYRCKLSITNRACAHQDLLKISSDWNFDSFNCFVFLVFFTFCMHGFLEATRFDGYIVMNLAGSLPCEKHHVGDILTYQFTKWDDLDIWLISSTVGGTLKKKRILKSNIRGDSSWQDLQFYVLSGNIGLPSCWPLFLHHLKIKQGWKWVKCQGRTIWSIGTSKCRYWLGE